MLIRLQELVRVGGVFEESTPLAINPLLIGKLRPEPLPGYEEPCCRMEVDGDEGPTFVAGDYESVMETIQGVEETAIEKLQVIAEIAMGEPQV